MMTGDNLATAKRIAAELGVDIVLAEVLPGQKAAKIKELQARGAPVEVMPILSPASGSVIEKDVVAGAAVEPSRASAATRSAVAPGMVAGRTNIAECVFILA